VTITVENARENLNWRLHVDTSVLQARIQIYIRTEDKMLVLKHWRFAQYNELIGRVNLILLIPCERITLINLT